MDVQITTLENTLGERIVKLRLMVSDSSHIVETTFEGQAALDMAAGFRTAGEECLAANRVRNRRKS